MTLMGGEPWCFPPETIAKLTDYQIRHLYYLPAVKRNRALKEQHMTPQQENSLQTAPQDVRELGDTKDDVVKLYREMGLSEATARAMANEQWKD